MLSGVILAVVQLDRVDALWTTSYGIVLSCKLAAVVALLALAAANRYVFVPRYAGGDAAAAGALTRTMTVELCIVAAILALVALWRFTPPPRALAAAEPIEVHLHGAARHGAGVVDAGARARSARQHRGARRRLQCADGQGGDGDARQSRGRDRAGAARRHAHPAMAHWRVEGLRIPVAGQWIVRVDLLIDDFEKIVLEEQVDLPRLP